MGASLREARTQHSGTPDTERLALLVDASRQLADAGLEPTTVLERLCELVVPRVGQACHVRLLSEDGDWLHSVSSAQVDPRLRPLLQRCTASPLRADEGVASTVLRTGQPVLLTPAEQAQFQLPVEQPSRRPPPSATHLLLLSLRARQRPLGLLVVHRDAESTPFEPGELLLLQELADRAGLALDVARAYKAERRARHAAEMTATR
ncbi:MAG TPA: GAF domain-containing protein, partial [Archangium sp.]|uniref:GAF domain-containing protein n=1 Tax=Archangium sp. TaxID=1872627 RepID=UPI002ED8BD3C